MCLAVPGQIMRVEDQGESRIGHIQFGGITRPAYLDFVPDAVLGDYVLVHVGFAISKVDAEEARRIFELIDEIS
jgi:hydrogenase expression/formation protein HypC